MTEENPTTIRSTSDPSFNVRELLEAAIKRQDNLREAEVHRIDHDLDTEVKRLDDKFKDGDVKYQIQFNAAKEALGIALIAQEKAVAAALEGTKEAIGKADIATDKRFELLSEKIDGVSETLNKNAGAQGIYVTHNDLNVEMEKLRVSFETMLRPVIAFMNSQTGQQKGTSQSWTTLATVIGISVAVITLLIKLVP